MKEMLSESAVMGVFRFGARIQQRLLMEVDLEIRHPGLAMNICNTEASFRVSLLKKSFQVLLLFALLFSITSPTARAQEVPVLEKKVSLSAQNEPIEEILKRLSQEAGCVFSYSSSSIDVAQFYSGSFKERPLREILEVIFEGEVQIKQKGVYVILTPKPIQETNVVISGYVVDENTGQGIRDATVYDPITLKSSTTDEYGYFQFEVKNPAEENFQIIVTKKDYADTLIFEDNNSTFQKILLKTKEIELEKVGKSIAEPVKDFWIWTKNSAGFTNLENVSDSINRKFQFSIVPFVGTNRKISGSVTNDYSINLLGGFSGGTNKAEVGGLFNINKGDVQSIQLAGWFNQAGGKVRGVQMAGLINANLDSVNAVQAAGLVNFTTGNVKGVQLAGWMNLTTKNLQGTQIAGLVNYAHGNVEGVQVSGILNVGRYVRGSQVGLFNYSDSTDGAPIGLISFVRKGYHKVEIGSDEVLPVNISLRTGTRSFYNMLFAGIRPGSADSTIWAFGYGIGTSPKLGKKTFLNIELSTEQLNKGNVAAFNLINRVYLGFEYQFAKGFGLYAGPSLNWRVYDNVYNDHPDLFTYTHPKILSEQTYQVEDLASQLWVGFRGGVRFF